MGETRPHSPHPAKTLWQQESGHPVPPPPPPRLATRKSFPLPSLILLPAARFLWAPRRAAARSQRGARRQVGAPCPMLILTLALPTEVWGFTSDLHQSPRGDPGRCARPGFPRVPPACRSVFPRLLSSQVRAGTAQNKHPSCLQAQSCGARGSGSSSSSRTWAPVGLRFLERRAGRQAVPAQECFPGPQPGFLLWGRLRREGDRRALGKGSGGFGAQDPGFCADSLPPLPRGATWPFPLALGPYQAAPEAGAAPPVLLETYCGWGSGDWLPKAPTRKLPSWARAEGAGPWAPVPADLPSWSAGSCLGTEAFCSWPEGLLPPSSQTLRRRAERGCWPASWGQLGGPRPNTPCFSSGRCRSHRLAPPGWALLTVGSGFVPSRGRPAACSQVTRRPRSSSAPTGTSSPGPAWDAPARALCLTPQASAGVPALPLCLKPPPLLPCGLPLDFPFLPPADLSLAASVVLPLCSPSWWD